MKVCPNCHRKVRNQQEVCPYCEIDLNSKPSDTISIEKRFTSLDSSLFNSKHLNEDTEVKFSFKNFLSLLVRFIRRNAVWFFMLILLIIGFLVLLTFINNRKVISYLNRSTQYENILINENFLTEAEKNRIRSMRQEKVLDYLNNDNYSYSIKFPTYNASLVDSDFNDVFNDTYTKDNFKITASSTRDSENSKKYSVDNLTDNNSETMWSSNANCTSFEDILTITNTSDSIQTFDTIDIVSGNYSDEQADATPTQLILKRGELYWYVLNLDRNESGIQQIKFDADVSLEPGASIDLCISDAKLGGPNSSNLSTITELKLYKRPFWDL